LFLHTYLGSRMVLQMLDPRIIAGPGLRFLINYTLSWCTSFEPTTPISNLSDFGTSLVKLDTCTHQQVFALLWLS